MPLSGLNPFGSTPHGRFLRSRFRSLLGLQRLEIRNDVLHLPGLLLQRLAFQGLGDADVHRTFQGPELAGRRFPHGLLADAEQSLAVGMAGIAGSARGAVAELGVIKKRLAALNRRMTSSEYRCGEQQDQDDKCCQCTYAHRISPPFPCSLYIFINPL